jgi:short-subunit dehydrogenase
MSKRVLITGASSGIGKATALAFAAEKAQLYLAARREDRLNEVAEACRHAGAPAVTLGAHDLSISGEGTRMVQQALTELGHLDIMILNAGYGSFQPVSEYPAEKMARMWQVNFQSAYESIQAILPDWLKAEKGHIVLISSLLGKIGIPYSAPYCATKFAQVGLAQSLWGELREYGIGVSVVCPGYTRTEFHDVAASKSNKSSVSRPLKAQTSETVAQAILDAVRRNKREVHLSWQGKLILAIDRVSSALSSRIMLRAGQSNR